MSCTTDAVDWRDGVTAAELVQQVRRTHDLRDIPEVARVLQAKPEVVLGWVDGTKQLPVGARIRLLGLAGLSEEVERILPLLGNPQSFRTVLRDDIARLERVRRSRQQGESQGSSVCEMADLLNRLVHEMQFRNQEETAKFLCVHKSTIATFLMGREDLPIHAKYALLRYAGRLRDRASVICIVPKVAARKIAEWEGLHGSRWPLPDDPVEQDS